MEGRVLGGAGGLRGGGAVKARSSVAWDKTGGRSAPQIPIPQPIVTRPLSIKLQDGDEGSVLRGALGWGRQPR